jgi:hypothetical protein
MARVSITLSESASVELPGQHICLFGVAVDTGSNPIVGLVSTVAC